MENISEYMNLFQEISGRFPKINMVFYFIFAIEIGVIVFLLLIKWALKVFNSILKEMKNIIFSIEKVKCKHKELKIKTCKKEIELSEWKLKKSKKTKYEFLQKIRKKIFKRVHIKLEK